MILHSLDEFELYIIGIDVDEASIACNGWRWEPRRVDKHLTAATGVSPWE
jgi:hypothetical protein